MKECVPNIMSIFINTLQRNYISRVLPRPPTSEDDAHGIEKLLLYTQVSEVFA